MSLSWDRLFAARTARMSSSTVRELLKVTEQPDFISFAGGMPAPEVFPVDEVAGAAARILRDAGPQALQYGATEGYRPLRELVAEHMARDGVPATVENVLITTGSQQALDLLGRVLIDPGDRVLVESPTYLAALQAWNPYGAEYLEAPADDDGMRTEGLDALLDAGPKFVYALPNFQNPSGVTLAAERRATLARLAAGRGVPVVEDDPYRELRFEGEDLPRIIEHDARLRDETRYAGGVIYLSTFSKTLAPGLRVGWVVAAPELIARLVQAKQCADLHTAMLNQMLAHDLWRSGFLERHRATIVREYRARRDAMLAALAETFPAGATWTHPAGGMFLWVRVPGGVDTAELLSDALARRVAFVPGAPFHPGGGGRDTMRLNFSNSSPALIRTCVERLAEALRARLEVTRPRASRPRGARPVAPGTPKVAVRSTAPGARRVAARPVADPAARHLADPAAV